MPTVVPLTSAALREAQRGQADLAALGHVSDGSCTSSGYSCAASIRGSSMGCSPASSCSNFQLHSSSTSNTALPLPALGAQHERERPTFATICDSIDEDCGSELAGCRGQGEQACALGHEQPHVAVPGHHTAVRQRQQQQQQQQQQQALGLGVRLRRAALRVRRCCGALAQALAARMQPQGHGTNDGTLLERVMNVLTCVPLVLSGRDIMRRSAAPPVRRFGQSLRLMGVVAGVYHTCWGPRVKALARKADYWAIAMGSCALRCAVLQPARPAGGGSGSGSGLQRVCTLASLAVMPFAPSKVSSANFAVVETLYATRAIARPTLRRGWLRHLGLSATAGACFLLEETPLLHAVPCSHALWHCLGNAALSSALKAADVAAEPKH